MKKLMAMAMACHVYPYPALNSRAPVIRSGICRKTGNITDQCEAKSKNSGKPNKQKMQNFEKKIK